MGRSLPTRIRRFWAQERGAVTVDWVALTAAIVGMSVLVISLIVQGAIDPAEGVAAQLVEMQPGAMDSE